MNKKVIRLFFTFSMSVLSNFTLYSKDNVSNSEQLQMKEKNSAIRSERMNAPMTGDYLEADLEDTPYQNDSVIFNVYAHISEEIIGAGTFDNGMTLIEPLYFNDNYQANVKYNVSEKNATSTIDITLANDERIDITIFAFNTEHGVFLNTESMQMAEDNYYAYLLHEELITEEYYNEMTYGDTAENIDSEDLSAVNVDTVSDPLVQKRKDTSTFLRGTILWYDDVNQFIQPLSWIRVGVFDKQPFGERSLGEFYTDEYGNYSYQFLNKTLFENGGYDVFLRVYAECKNARVVKSLFFNNVHYINSSVIRNVKTHMYYTIDMTIKMYGDSGRAFQIAQALAYGNKYVEIMNDGVTAPPVKAKYPASSSYYNSSGIHYYRSAYCFWDCILHEYGHHLQKMLKISNSSVSNHYFEDDSVRKIGKDKGIRLAWGEAWPTLFAIQVTQYFSNKLLRMKFIGDSTYQSYGEKYSKNKNDIITFNLEEKEYYYSSEGCEGLIAAVLYDIYDDNNDEPFDQIGLGHKEFWNLIKACGSKTFSEFINYIYDNELIDKRLLGKILSSHHISSYDLFIVEDNYLGPNVTFSWYVGGGTNEKTVMDRFTLEFYDYYGNVSLRLDNIYDEEYTLNYSFFEEVLLAPGDFYYVSVISYQTSTPITGGYYSEFFYFKKPDYFNSKYILYPSSYQFSEAYEENYTKPIMIKDMVITTERKRCGFIEGEYINLSPRKEGRGVAYITYKFSKPIQHIDFSLSLWGKSEYLKPEQSKIAIQILNYDGIFKDEFMINVNTLSNDRQKQIVYSFSFLESIDQFRIYVETLPVGTANKGRISIGSMMIY